MTGSGPVSLLFRLLRVVAAALWFRPPLGALEASVLTLRVWPTDLDLNGHMNNGRYLTLMDLGRIDLMLRNGIGRLALRRGWRPVIGSAMIRYRRSLEPFDRYGLVSRVLAWDDRWFFVEQRFERDGQAVAVAAVKGLMLSKGVRVPTGEVLRALGAEVESPPIPEAIRLWQAADLRLFGDEGRAGQGERRATG